MDTLIISYDKTIRSHFSADQEVLICLFPFQKQVFAEHFNWEANLKFTYPLLSTIAWTEISKEIQFNSLNRLAIGILELQEPFKTELTEYCEWKKIEMPDYAADRIPAVTLIPIINYLQNIRHTSIGTKKIDRFPDSESRIVQFGNKNEFEIYLEIKDSKALTTENGIEILLPDYDCPYFIISGSKDICDDILEACELEYFNTKNDTPFDWWNQKEI